MRRAVVVLGTTAAGLAALFSYKTHVAGIAVASTSPATPAMSAPATTPPASPSASPSPSKTAKKKSTPKAPAKTTPAATQSTAPAATPTTKKAAPPPSPSAPAGKSGTFTGPAEDTQFGQVQVSITVSNGKITNANGSLPQGGDGIAQNALPQLNSQALSAQSAHIQGVSGATYTSQGYIGSLQQAVNQAGL